MLPVTFDMNFSDFSKLNLSLETVPMVKVNIHQSSLPQCLPDPLPLPQQTLKSDHRRDLILNLRTYTKTVVCVAHILTVFLFACGIPCELSSIIYGFILQTPSVWLIPAVYSIIHIDNTHGFFCGIVYVFLFPFWLTALIKSGDYCVNKNDVSIVSIMTVVSSIAFTFHAYNTRMYLIIVSSSIIFMISIVVIDTCGRVAIQSIQILFCLSLLASVFGLMSLDTTT